MCFIVLFLSWTKNRPGDKRFIASECTSNAVPPLAQWYTDLRSNTAKVLLTAESQAIRAMAEAFPRSLTSKCGRSATTSKKLKGA